jgi:hypothetical protein
MEAFLRRLDPFGDISRTTENRLAAAHGALVELAEQNLATKFVLRLLIASLPPQTAADLREQLEHLADGFEADEMPEGAALLLDLSQPLTL